MSGRKRNVCTLFRLLLLLAWLLAFPKGLMKVAAADGEELVLSSEEEALEALLTLSDGQDLRLNVSEVRLDETLTIEASNFTVSGTRQRTRIRCPKGRNAFVIRAENVVLSALEFTECEDSALKIEKSLTAHSNSHTAETSDSQSGSNDQEGRESSVSVIDCLFRGNRAQLGAAINADQSSLLVQNSTFEGNNATECGGAIYAPGGEITVNNSSFIGNVAGSGGAIFTQNSESLTVTHSNLTNNSAAYCQGCEAFSSGKCGAIESKRPTTWRSRTGGAIQAMNCKTVTIAASSFQDNDAERHGGAIHTLLCTRVDISGFHFQNNKANFDGGAVLAYSCPNVTIASSFFKGNIANRNGGTVGANRCRRVTIEDSVLEENSADSNGGAVHSAFGGELSLHNVVLQNNSARWGGAVSVTRMAALRASSSSNNVTFQHNTAFRGGAIFCYFCDISLGHGASIIQGNVAAESGGGVFMNGAAISGHISSDFVGNVASFGGGIAMRRCLYVLLRDMRLSQNVAIDGGGIHISSVNGQVERYDVRNVTFESNWAHSLTNMRLLQEDASISWLNAREKYLTDDESEWLRLDECWQGRGGGEFISVQDLSQSSNLNLLFYDSSVRDNTANVGGGLYIDSGDVSKTYCRSEELISRPCLFINFSSTELVDNVASIAGGGLFTRSVSSLSTHSISEISRLSEECSTPPNNADALCFRDNRVSCDDGACYGAQFATGAQSLQLQNVHGALTGLHSGDRLVVRGDENERSLEKESIILLVTDALNRKITEKIPDSYLCVVILSNRTTEERRYCAVNGVIKINATSVAGVNIEDTLVFQSDDERKINATLNFSTLPCQNGELPSRSNSECFRCSSRSYAFEADSTECRECEENARCGGTTMLVPDDGYWHSTPFSPFIRRCAIKKACSFKNRSSNLTQYYNSTDIQVKLERVRASVHETSKNSSEDYTQCASGYEGVLCGECAEGHGRTTSGVCRKCDENLATARCLTFLGIVMLFIVITIKVTLGANGVRDKVYKLLSDKKNALKRNLERWMSSSSSDVQTATGDAESANHPRTSSRHVAEGTVAPSGQARPPLKRTNELIEDPFEERGSKTGRRPSAALFVASSMMVSTFNILFNYVQLNSIAFHLDLDWKLALNSFFAVNGALGRALHLEFLPLDCTFSDRDDDEGTPNSIVVLWYRVCLPLTAMVIFFLLIVAAKLVRGERRLSKYAADVVPSLTMIFLIIYLAFCIDLVSDFLKVFNCHDLSSEIQKEHTYREFEALELGAIRLNDTIWLEDTGVKCWEGEHLLCVVFAAIGLLLCLLVVSFMVAMLYRGNKTKRLDEPRFMRRYGILYLPYRTVGLALHWESVITVRKMLLVAIEVYVSRRETTGVQVGLFSVAIFVFLALHCMFLPFREEDAEHSFPKYAGNEVRLICPESLRNRWVDFNRSVTLNGLEGASLFMSLSFFMVAACIADDQGSEFESDILLSSCFSLNVAFFLFMLYRLWYGLHNYLDARADGGDISFKGSPEREQDRDTYLVIKVWRLLPLRRELNEDDDQNGMPLENIA